MPGETKIDPIEEAAWPTVARTLLARQREVRLGTHQQLRALFDTYYSSDLSLFDERVRRAKKVIYTRGVDMTLLESLARATVGVTFLAMLKERQLNNSSSLEAVLKQATDIIEHEIKCAHHNKTTCVTRPQCRWGYLLSEASPKCVEADLYEMHRENDKPVLRPLVPNPVPARPKDSELPQSSPQAVSSKKKITEELLPLPESLSPPNDFTVIPPPAPPEIAGVTRPTLPSPPPPPPPPPQPVIKAQAPYPPPAAASASASEKNTLRSKRAPRQETLAVSPSRIMDGPSIDDVDAEILAAEKPERAHLVTEEKAIPAKEVLMQASDASVKIDTAAPAASTAALSPADEPPTALAEAMSLKDTPMTDAHAASDPAVSRELISDETREKDDAIVKAGEESGEITSSVLPKQQDRGVAVHSPKRQLNRHFQKRPQLLADAKRDKILEKTDFSRPMYDVAMIQRIVGEASEPTWVINFENST